MPDDLIQSGIPAVAQPPVQPLGSELHQVFAEVVQSQAPAVPAIIVAASADDQEAPAPDVIEKLESILVAIGHELPVFWHEAVALAKKAI